MQQEEPVFTNEEMHRKMDKIETLYEETQRAWKSLGGYNTIADLVDEEEEDTPQDLSRSTADASLDMIWTESDPEDYTHRFENKFVYRAN